MFCKLINCLCCLEFLSLVCSGQAALDVPVAEVGPIAYVNPYIGSGGHGHVFVGAGVPFGGVQVGPTNFNQGWDWPSGYHYSDDVMAGFTMLHLNGTGCADLSDILIMPYMGKLRTSSGTKENPEEGYAARYTHEQEVVRPNYYAVVLDSGVKVELTATERVGLQRYAFPKKEEGHIIVDLKFGYSKAKETYLKKLDDTTLVGYRFSHGWANDRREFFAIKFSQPIKDFKLFNDDEAEPLTVTELKEKFVKGVISYDQAPEQITLKVGISPISTENALANIEAEAPDWNFEKAVKDGNEKWNHELGKITVSDQNEDAKRIFYTSLYHAFIAPTLYNDHNGDYRGTDKKVYQNPGFTNYSIFSLWDTYRAQHPLLTIIQPERVSDIITSMLMIYKQQGRLPIWHLRGNDTNTMVGYSGIPPVIDAYFKGFNIDVNLAWDAVKKSSMRDDEGLKWVKEKGFIPCDKKDQSVARALEYAISDWCIAQMAKALNKNSEYDIYAKRGKYYLNYYDPAVGFFRGKKEDGSWDSPFKPDSMRNLTEGIAWQYIWLVPQDVEGLIDLLGGEDNFAKKMDQFFTTKFSGQAEVPDMTGMIGMYCAGNEPDHQVIYMYPYVGQQWKTAQRARQVLTEMYHAKPDGLSGNEDCGQMSAWYILSALGFYQVNPASGCYVFGSPLFEKAIIALPQGKNFTITTENNSAENIYIQSVELNQVPYTKSYITYRDIMNGGTLKFVMGKEPNRNFGAEKKDRPQSMVYQ
jgi:predicted alpha-1,2-mannosidase